MADFPTVKSGDATAAMLMAGQANSVGRVKALTSQAVSSTKEVEKAVSGFEALLLHEMLQSMWSTVDSAGLLGEDSNQAQIYRDMLNQALSERVAEGRGLGVKKLVMDEIARRDGSSKR